MGKNHASQYANFGSLQFRNAAIKEVYYICGQYVKDSKELKYMLNECIVSTINKELKKEKQMILKF